MSNLKKRIEGLKSSTGTTEVIAACNEAIAQFGQYATFNLPAHAVQQFEDTIAESLIAKIESIDESAVNDFVNVEKRILGMNNLGVKKALNAIKESELSKHPQLMYMLERLKHTETSPEWQVANQIAEALSPFTWDAAVKEAHTNLVNNCKKYSEDIKIYNAVHEARNSRSSFVLSGIEKDVDNYLNHRTASNRAKLLESLNKFSYDPNIRSLYNTIIDTERSFQIREGSSDALVRKIYSPVIVTESDEIFAANGVAYVKNGNNIRPLTEEEANRLPDYFTFISSFVTQSNVEISENRMKIFSRDKKVELVEEKEGLGIYINNKKVTLNEFHSVYLNSGIFRFDEKEVITAVGKIVENWDAIMELDFAKSIYPKGMTNRRVDVFKLGNKTHIHTFDSLVKEAKFYQDCNANQTRNLVLEFAKYDLGLTFKDFLANEEVKIAELQSKKKEYLDAVAYLEEKKNLLESIEDESVRESDEVKELITALDEEISTVKADYFNVQNELKALTQVSEGANAGDEVEYLKKKQLSQE